ncbi:MAG: Decarbamoylnovobiocin carbamoyltransferase [Alphaproteobacteria bacterium MarineAlpha9_Bin4]|nr:hypothetical protein [Pelagibacterales bacterium]PPR27454.1 MAG: Decarbamoylnovobiocin carbamoyltransferase [Alphaproteobacteria bacterium MarineAlpha9_Bin4]
MKILGISSFYHDSAASLIANGKIISAVQEERFTRVKHDASFPKNAIKFCLEYSKLNASDIDYFCFYEKPYLKFERLLETYFSFAPYGFKSFRTAMPIWVKEKLFQKRNLVNELIKLGAKKDTANKVLFSEHHLSHAASAFYPSPYEEAAILTLDGVGEWATSTIGIGNKKNQIRIEKEIHFPHSLGLLYSAFTYYTGFKVNSGEYKLMGLAPYGDPIFVDKIFDNLLDVKSDGSFRLSQKYFDYCTGLKMINHKFENLFGERSRKEGQPITKFYMNVAASIQKVLEYTVLKICKNIRKETGQKYLCMAGGVALNCVINGKIVKEGIFDDIWIQPAAGDAGGALGAALLSYYEKCRTIRKNSNLSKDHMKGSLLGPSYNNKEINKELEKVGAKAKNYSIDNIVKLTTDALANQKIVGWFQGNMEFGPRALGNRSIIADPRSSKMQKNLNLSIKFRENFRPFAPSILEDKLPEWFELENISPYMLLVLNLNKSKLKKIKNRNFNDLHELLAQKRSVVPAITHVDNSARVQTVNKETNPLYYKLIKSFYNKTKCPILINTSFNIRSEPIVCSPTDAFKCFMGTDMDVLVVGNYIMYKNLQNKNLLKDYRESFELD